MFKLPSIIVKKDSAAPYAWYLKWYYKLHDGLQRNTFKSLEKEVNQLKEDEKLSSLLQGKEVIEQYYAVARSKVNANCPKATEILSGFYISQLSYNNIL